MRQFWSIRVGAIAALVAAMVAVRGIEAQEPRVAADPAGAAGDTLALSLADAQRFALQQNPAHLADRQEAAIARGQLRQARAYSHNPELEASAPGVASDGSVGEYEIALTQEVEWAGQWGLRSGAARLGLERANYAVRNAARSALGEVSIAYFEALAAGRRFAVSTAVLDLNQRLLTATRIQLREGEISTLEANLAEIEYGRTRARVLAARREVNSTTVELKRLIGIAAEQPVRLRDDSLDAPDPASLSADSLLAVALARRPDLAASRAAVSQFETLRRLAGREAIPNLRLGVVADREGPGDASRLGLGIGLGLPLWNRNRGLVAERVAQMEQATLLRRATELRVRAEVAAAHAAYLAASEEAQVYEASVLQPARENQGLLETAYRAGKVNLSTLLLLRNQLFDAELGYWDAWLVRRTALMALNAATASLAPEGALPTNDSETNR